MSNESKVCVSPLDVTWHDVSGKNVMEVSETADAVEKESQTRPGQNMERTEPTSVKCSQCVKNRNSCKRGNDHWRLQVNLHYHLIQKLCTCGLGLDSKNSTRPKSQTAVNSFCIQWVMPEFWLYQNISGKKICFKLVLLWNTGLLFIFFWDLWLLWAMKIVQNFQVDIT